MQSAARVLGKVLADVEQEWQAALAAAQQASQPAPTALLDAGDEQLRQVLYAPGSPTVVAAGDFRRFMDQGQIEHSAKLQKKVIELRASTAAPPNAMALVDRPTPVNPRILLRGNPGNAGPEVPRQFLGCLAGPERKPFEHGSGRLELAQAIVDPANPLTARVLVNRVWLQHFGVGLVRTPSDFGLRSEPPSHPELLDHLAYDFIHHGWSLKWLHRQILLSSTYQQASTDRPECRGPDPENRLLWRMNRRRLEWEALRDALLAASGTLDLTIGGHSVDLMAEPFSHRRTVYGMIDRQNLPGVVAGIRLRQSRHA